MKRGPSGSAPSIIRGDSHGVLCGNRRVVGTEQRVRCGRDREDRAGSRGGERTGGAGPLFQPTGGAGDADRSGALSQWLHAGLSAAGFEAVLLETRHVKAALSAMVVKTDRKDARGIAQLLRMGWYRPVHRKSADAQEVRALLVGRKLLQGKLRDVEFSIRGILRGFGLKVGEVSKGRFAARVEELIGGHAMLEAVIGAMLTARAGLHSEFMRLHRRVLAIVRADQVCRRLMTVPGVGALVAVTFKVTVDDPGRFTSSKSLLSN